MNEHSMYFQHRNSIQYEEFTLEHSANYIQLYYSTKVLIYDKNSW